MHQQPPPNILNYDNYLPYLNDYYEYKKKFDRAFSYRYLARYLDVSAAHIKFVFDGKRSLSHELALKMAKQFDMSQEQEEKFLRLVKYGEKYHIFECDEEGILPILIVSEMICLKDFTEDADWMSEKVGRLITKDQVQQAFDYLKDNGHIKKENGVWKKTQYVYYKPISNQEIDLISHMLKEYLRQIGGMVVALNSDIAKQIFKELGDVMRKYEIKSKELTEREKLFFFSTFVVELTAPKDGNLDQVE